MTVLPEKERGRQLGLLGQVGNALWRTGAICLAVLDAIDLLVVAVLLLLFVAALWFDQWTKSPFVAVLVLYLGFLSVRKWILSSRESEE